MKLPVEVPVCFCAMLKSMRVLYEHRTQATCAEGEHIRGVVGAFRSLGHEIEVVEPPFVHSEGEKTRSVATFSTDRAGLPPSVLSLLAVHLPEAAFELCELAYNLWETPRLLWRSWRIDPHLLYARYSLFTFAPALVAKALKIPFVLEINDATFIKRSRPLVLHAVARTIEGYVFRQARLCVTISRQFAELAESSLRLERDKFLVLPNAITPERFSPNMRKTGNGCVLGVVGAFVPWHGLDFLMDAVAHLRSRHPEMRVLLVGDGPIRSQIEAQVKHLQLQEVVQFTGFVPPSEVPEFLQRMDVCIIPDSNAHGSPMKLFEYMAMSKPTVAPSYPPIAEVIEDGVTGLLFAPRDLGDFIRQIRRLLQEPALADRIGRQARQHVLERHTWQENVRTLLRELQILTASRYSM